MNTTQLLITAVIAVALYVWTALSLSAVFRKAGESAWQAWVPILNIGVLLRLGGLSPWLALLAIVPGPGTIALFVILIIALNRVNRAFGLGAGMTVLGAILLPAWASIVGWGSARWLASAAPEAPARRRASADSAWLASQPSAPLPFAAPATGTGLGSVFGANGPAGGPEVPPRPAPPTIDGYPSVVPAAVDRSGGPVPVGRGGVPLPHVDPSGAFPPPVTGAGVPTRAFLHSGVPGPRPPRSVDDIDDTEGSRTPAGPPVPAFQPLLASAELTYESSAEVSAVQGAPTLGAPRSARTSVSAQHKRPEIPEEESFDETIVAVRRRTVWTLVPAQGAPVPLTAEVVIVGRRPHSAPEDGAAQLLAIPDETRTVSKTHARMELTADGWTIVDLDSTNGVILIAEDGAETDAAPGRPERLTARFLLGDAEFGLRREGE